MIDRTQLTERERQVAELTMQGLNHAQIAERMHISTHTVRCHTTSIHKRWRLPKRTKLADIAWLASIAQKEIAQ